MPIILFRELLSEYNTNLYPKSIGSTLKLHRTKYLHVSLLAKIKQRKIFCRKISSLTNQNVEEINMTRK